MLAALMNQAHVAQVMRDYDGDQLQCKILTGEKFTRLYLHPETRQIIKRFRSDVKAAVARRKQEG